MWLPAVTITPPEAEPVLLAAAKQYLRIDAGDDSFDDEIATYIAASRAEVESITNTRLIRQEVVLQAGSLADLEHLPIGPVQSIEAVNYIDQASDEQLLPDTDYALVASGLEGQIIRPSGVTWPTVADRADAVRVTAIVGYGDAGSDLPRDLYFVVLQAIRAKFDGRELAIEQMLVNHRIWMS
ncbi:hypothetical protein [Blastomonas sp. CCH5-A3]|jgi:uncharacterized phiE125 gp8 family phage protein|uniref:head-tail connector protein n=1 Tax=Blastomonas sp. CCH5-A3 TaxID=1768761 RepID=UPI0008263A2C|nr:hypothetical protein [Blastomonas sp. CCH5-A3]MAF60210.1 hypothetical protein [Blastomonas sp.]|tara:strand:+ start:121383 stop:121931 length:549 start_codon:yes stop_codon:yes gene_type:complete